MCEDVTFYCLCYKEEEHFNQGKGERRWWKGEVRGTKEE